MRLPCQVEPGSYSRNEFILDIQNCLEVAQEGGNDLWHDPDFAPKPFYYLEYESLSIKLMNAIESEYQ